MEAIVNVRTKELEKLCEYAMRPDFERMRMWQWGQGIAIYSLEKELFIFIPIFKLNIFYVGKCILYIINIFTFQFI